MSHITQEELDDLFFALSHFKRREIITTLAYCPATIDQLAKEHFISLPAIYKHIKILEQSGLVRRKKDGRTNFLALNPSRLAEVKNWGLQFNTAWGSDNESLENYIQQLTNQE